MSDFTTSIGWSNIRRGSFSYADTSYHFLYVNLLLEHTDNAVKTPIGPKLFLRPKKAPEKTTTVAHVTFRQVEI